MNNETENLMKHLMDISKDMNSLIHIQNTIDTEGGIILGIDTSNNLLSNNFKMSNLIDIKNYNNIKSVLKSEANNSLYLLMQEYATYEKALKVKYPEMELYQVINMYIEYSNNSNAISSMIKSMENKIPAVIELGANINTSNNNQSVNLYSNKFKFSRSSDQELLLNYLSIIIQSSDAYLDDIAQVIISNLNKEDEVNEEESGDKVVPIETDEGIIAKEPLAEPTIEYKPNNDANADCICALYDNLEAPVPVMEAEVSNKNKRSYSKDVLDKAISEKPAPKKRTTRKKKTTTE